MELTEKIVVITGAAGGIGSACAHRFAAEGLRRLVCADLDGAAAERVATEVNEATGSTVAVGRACDVGREASVRNLIEDVSATDGTIDLYFANAGIATLSDPFTDDEVWDRAWRVHTMAHVWAARHLLPAWLARGDGHLVTTASVAGLLTAMGDAAYTASKHAAVGLAEWLAITYRDEGIRVSTVCPAGVDTQMLAVFAGDEVDGEDVGGVDVMSTAEAAEQILAGIREDATLILTHPEIEVFLQRKVGDHARWVGGMVRQWRDLRGALGRNDPVLAPDSGAMAPQSGARTDEGQA
jgi:NAD(P)-dependent dehydrogenase (short-subunit alcohol dehydrogenase family)